MSKDRDITSLLQTGGGAAVLEAYQEWNEAQLLQQPLGRYRVLSRIGSGGMSLVYRGERDDGEFKRQVAIKVLEPSLISDRLQARFLREKEILASLNHANIAQLYDTGVTETGFPYIVMELIEGEPLDQYLQHRQLAISECVALFKALVSAVSYAHQRLIIHRDLKPRNVMVTQDGEPKLLDFGIARLLDDKHGHTTQGRSPFTPNFASPEQLLNRDITTASDIYQLGMLLYVILCNRSPHADLDLGERITSAAEERLPPPPSRLDFGRPIPRELDAIALKCVRPSPQHRYQAATELLADLDRFQNGFPVEAVAGGLMYRAGRFVRRHRMAVGIGTVSLVLILIITGALNSRLSRVAEEAQNLESSSNKLVATLAGLFEGASPYDPQIASPSVDAVLQLAKQEIDQSLADEPALRSRLLTAMGNTERQLGRYIEAENHLRLSLELAEIVDNDVAAGTARSNLALLLIELSELDEAEALLDQVASFTQNHDDPLFKTDLHLHRAQLAVSRGNPGEMQASGRAALEELDQAQLTDPLRQADAYHFIGRGLLDADPLEARAYFERADRLISQSVGEGHLARARVLLRLGNTYQASGDYEFAEDLYRQALQIQESLLGPTHVALSTGHGNIGLARRGLGDLDGAIEEYRMALNIAQSTLGQSNRGVGAILMNLGNALEDAGETAESLQAFREALAIFEALRAPGDIGKASNNYGFGLYRIGQYEESVPILDRSLTLKSQAYGADSLTTSRTRLGLVQAHIGAGSVDYAQDNLGRAIDAFHKSFGTDHQKLSYPYMVLGEFELARGNTAAAIESLEASLRWRVQEYGPDGIRTADVLELLARSHLAAGDLATAESYADRALAVVNAQSRPNDILQFRFSITQAMVRRAQGRESDALIAFQNAEDVLSDAEVYDRLWARLESARSGLAE